MAEDSGAGLMSQKEAQRYAVIEQVLQGHASQALAAQQLGLSVRQIKRLCAGVRQHGTGALISRRRGQPSNRRISAARKSAIMAIVAQHYGDFGPQLACEYLAATHGQAIGVETLRGWMIEAGLWQAKRRRKTRQHLSRPRRDRLGELVQIDGSHHDWFEGRAPKCCLIAFIDDATGRVLAARLSPTETTLAYFAVLSEHVSTHGAPLAYYSDRHGIFTKHERDDPAPTQFERALLQLAIEGICASTPQAKGRVERLFQTLQDRLCKAMRLASIDSIEQANAWLPGYVAAHNERFAVAPREPHDAHRPFAGTPEQLARICALHHQRQLSSQLSCQFEGSQIWITPGQVHAPKGKVRVDIAEHGDGALEVLWRGQVLAHRAYTLHEHLRGKRAQDDKTLNQRVDALAREQRRMARLHAEIALQDDLRRMGIHRPDTHVSAPPQPGRYGLRPSQPGCGVS